MQTYFFIGGNHDGLSVPVQPDQDTIQLPAGVTGKDTYIRETLAVGDVSITIYRHESLTAEQVLNRLIEHYKAWCVNRPGGRGSDSFKHVRLGSVTDSIDHRAIRFTHERAPILQKP